MLKWYERCEDAVHNENYIKGFFEDYRYLSNYHECKVGYDGEIYTSSEAAYQAAKTLNKVEREPFTKMTPSESKKAGQKVTLRSDWEEVKNQIMEEILYDKFLRNQDIKTKLLETGEKYLEETNWWNDCYWGVCLGHGRNMLGLTLMKVREALK